MKKAFVALAALALLAAVVAWFASAPRRAFDEAQAASLDQGGDAEKGKLVFAIGGCASCHMTPKQDNRALLGGGHRLVSPFGTFVAPNISADKEDGVGAWRTIDLANAMISGVSKAGENLYPAFPYTSYHAVRVEDVKDLMAYLRTVPAVKGKAGPHELPFPFNIRRAVGLWKFLFFKPTPFAPDPAQSAEWNRGAYLVNALGHCAECHSGRNFLGAIDPDRRFAGAYGLDGKGYAPNLTSAPDGLGKWSAKDVAELLKSGFTPEYDSVGGEMADVVRNTAQLSDADRMAMAVYLKSLPAKASPPSRKKAE